MDKKLVLGMGALVFLGVLFLFGSLVSREVDLTSRGSEEAIYIEVPGGFTYVTKEEARILLDEAEAKGEFKFLFPQVDLSGVERISVANREVVTPSGKRITLLGISGLPSGTEFYASVDGVTAATTIDYETVDAPPLLMFESEGDTLSAETYVTYDPSVNDVVKEFEKFKDVEIGESLAVISSQTLIEEVFPVGWQMALVVEGFGNLRDKVDENAAIENVLTRDGRILMILR